MPIPCECRHRRVRVPLHLTVRQSSSLKTTGAGNSNDSWFYWIDFHKFLDGYQFSSVTFLLDPFLNWISFHPFHMIIWIQKLRFLVSLFCCFDLWHGSSYFPFDSYWIGIQKTPENLQELDPATNSTLSRSSKTYPGTATNWIHHVSLNFPLQEFLTNWIDQLLGVGALLLLFYADVISQKSAQKISAATAVRIAKGKF